MGSKLCKGELSWSSKHPELRSLVIFLVKESFEYRDKVTLKQMNPKFIPHSMPLFTQEQPKNPTKLGEQVGEGT